MTFLFSAIRRRRLEGSETALAVGIAIVVLGLSFWSGRQLWSTPGPAVALRLVQMDLPVVDGWTRPDSVTRLVETAKWMKTPWEAAQKDLTRVVLTPEGILSADSVHPSAALRAAMENFAAAAQGPVLFNGFRRGTEGNWYNSAFFVDAENRVATVDKRKLVPFGEFIPAGFRWFVDLLGIPLSDLAPGKPEQPNLNLGRGIYAGLLICYENIDGEVLRSFWADPEKDPGIFFVTANLGWFAPSIIPQHLDMTRLLALASARHKEGKKVVVILNIGGVIETASWKSEPDAILLAWQAGQEGGNTVADILSGKVNPSGKLPMTFPVSIADVASTKNFPDASGIDLKEMLAGFMGGGPEHTDRKNIDYTNYEEGIYVGYRYFDTFGVPVSYPFGYGQSYTTFNYSSLKVFMGDTDYSISCTITNNGPVAGKEVVQLYISAPGKSMDKPAKELRGFVKTQLLQPGESREIIFKVKDTDLASFDESASHWVVESGKYEAQIGSSAADIRLRDSFNVKGRVTEKVHAVLLPGERIDLLKR